MKEFELTPSASLTLEQFNDVDLVTEADPPAYTRNRLMEARAKAIDDNNIPLLSSGQLDDPMKKHMDRWRNGKTSKNQTESDKLYKSLGEKMETVHGSKQDQNYSLQHPEEHNFDENRNKKASDARSIVPCSTSLTQSTWEKAYPRRNGKKIILPHHSTAEMIAPSTQPVEGTIDIRSFKRDMPQDMKVDIEKLLYTPEESATKESVFNKINKDYLLIQEQKEKKRSAADEEKENAEKDLAAQRNSKKRAYKKRKDRNQDTTQALLDDLESRKVSRKINYDAMKSIFDDGSCVDENEDSFAHEQEEHFNIDDL